MTVVNEFYARLFARPGPAGAVVVGTGSAIASRASGPERKKVQLVVLQCAPTNESQLSRRFQDPMEVGKSRKRIGKRHHPKPREDAVCALIRKIQALRIDFKKAHLGEADQSSTPGQVEGDAGDVDPDDTAIKAHALGQLQTDCPAPQATSTTTSLSSGDKASIARTPRGDS